MQPRTLMIAVIAVLWGLGATAAGEEKWDKALKELDQQFAKIKSYTAKMEAWTDSKYGPDHKQKMEMTGTTEWVRQGKKALMHSDMKQKTTKTEGGETTTTVSTITTVSDGDFMYMLMEEDGKKTVMKNRAQPAKSYHPRAIIVQMKSYYDIKLLPDEKVEGNDCYVFEMKMKPMEGMPSSGRQLWYYQKDNGIAIKTQFFDADGKQSQSSISKDIKIDADISPDRFKFEIPPDAEVHDMTATEQPQVQPQKPEAAAEEEQTEPKKEEPKKKSGIKIPKLPKRP